MWIDIHKGLCYNHNMNRRTFLNRVMFGAVAVGALGIALPKVSAAVPKINKLNSKRLTLQIQEDIIKVAEYFTFEPNDALTRKNFNEMLSSIIEEKYVRTKAIHSFHLVNDERTNPPSMVDTNSMAGNLFIAPTPDSFYILIDFVVAFPETKSLIYYMK